MFVNFRASINSKELPGNIYGAHGPFLAKRNGMSIFQVVPLFDGLRFGVQQRHRHSGGEPLDLAFPVEKCRQRSNDQERTGVLVHFAEVAKQGYGLQGFS